MQFVVAAISSRALTPFSSRGGAAQRRRHRKHYILCSRERRKILGMPYVLPSNRCRHQLSNSDTIFALGRRQHRKHYISRSRERPKILGKRPPAGSPIIECNWPSLRSSTPSAPRRGARNENPTHRLPAVAPRTVSYASRSRRPANSVAAPLSIVAASTSRQRPNTSCTSAELGPELKFDFWPSGEVHRGTAIQHHLDVQHSRLRAVIDFQLVFSCEFNCSASALGVKFTIFFLRLRRGVYLGWEGLLVRKDDFFSLHPQRSTPSVLKIIEIFRAQALIFARTRRRWDVISASWRLQIFEIFPPEANAAITTSPSPLPPNPFLLGFIHLLHH
ncbi:hypothetical protein C8R43DRAFT_1116628 [Mycena crocata]|nr:hypothetical protein C8R43DRAFT_1116628 [Mycena crocata]